MAHVASRIDVDLARAPSFAVGEHEQRTIVIERGRIPHKRLRLYFERYGCVRCERKNVLCQRCLGLVSDRLKRGDKFIEKQYRKARIPAQYFLKRREKAINMLPDLKDLV